MTIPETGWGRREMEGRRPLKSAEDIWSWGLWFESWARQALDRGWALGSVMPLEALKQGRTLEGHCGLGFV